MNLVLTVVVVAGTYMAACWLLAALGRLTDKAEAEPRADVTGADGESGGWSRDLHPQSTSCA